MAVRRAFPPVYMFGFAIGLTGLMSALETAEAGCRGFFRRGGCFSVQLKSLPEAFPLCIGAPQDCRGKPEQTQNNTAAPPAEQAPAKFFAAYRVACRDAQGNVRGDSTTRAWSPVSSDDARRAVMERFNATFNILCHGIDSRYRADRNGEWVS